jgi:hypothetical protein
MDKISEKIRKLMALADHPGTSTEEASAAAGMAAELALKYNLDLDAAVAGGKDRQSKNFECRPNTIVVSPRDRQALSWLANPIGNLYGCQSVIMHPGYCKYSIAFIGQAHNIALCESWLKYLWNSCQRANKDYNKQREFGSAKEAYIAKATFRRHFANEVYNRLGEKLASMRRGEAASTGTALMVVAWYDEEKKEVQAWMQANMKTKQSRNHSRRADAGAAHAGQQAGKAASLSDQIGSTSPRHRQIGA